MIDPSQMLAADDDSIGQIIGVVLVIAFAIVNAVASAYKKRQEQRHREGVRTQIEPTVRPMPPPPTSARPQVVIRSGPMPAPARKKAQIKPIKPKLRRAPVLPSQSPPAQPLPPLEPAASRVAPSSVPAQPQKRTTVDARAVARWLTPATLRQQFILTEILQPPLALRGAPVGDQPSERK